MNVRTLLVLLLMFFLLPFAASKESCPDSVSFGGNITCTFFENGTFGVKLHAIDGVPITTTIDWGWERWEGPRCVIGTSQVVYSFNITRDVLSQVSSELYGNKDLWWVLLNKENTFAFTIYSNVSPILIETWNHWEGKRVSVRYPGMCVADSNKSLSVSVMVIGKPPHQMHLLFLLFLMLLAVTVLVLEYFVTKKGRVLVPYYLLEDMERVLGWCVWIIFVYRVILNGDLWIEGWILYFFSEPTNALADSKLVDVILLLLILIFWEGYLNVAWKELVYHTGFGLPVLTLMVLSEPKFKLLAFLALVAITLLHITRGSQKSLCPELKVFKKIFIPLNIALMLWLAAEIAVKATFRFQILFYTLFGMHILFGYLAFDSVVASRKRALESSGGK